MTLRFRLIILALRLQFPPFAWLFRAYYGLAVWLSCRLVCRVEGVKSIYLSGSGARREVIYGLSDIDFKIFIGGHPNERTYRTIRQRFSLLRRFFPMLGPPDEKGIYFLDSFEADYRHYPLVQHLFDERFFKHRRIWGEDLWSQLPLKPWTDLDQGECLFGRLRDWMERIHLLADCADLCLPQKQHLFFKAVSEVGLLSLRLDAPELSFSRRAEILQSLAPTLEDPHRQWMENLVRSHHSLYRHPLNSLEENFQLFKKMVAVCVGKAWNQHRSGSLPAGLRLTPPCPIEEKTVSAALQSLSTHIRGVKAYRWPHLPLNPFDLEFFDVPVYLAECSQPLTLEEFHNLKLFFRDSLKHRTVVLLREYPQFVSAVDTDLVDHWGSFAGSSDLLHLFLSESSPKVLHPLERERIQTRVRSFLEQLSTTLAHREFGRMDLSVFPRFLFNALRMLILEQELLQGNWVFPITPVEVAEYLARRTPLGSAFPGRLLAEYERGAGRRGHFDERLLPKCRSLLTTMLEISRQRQSWEPLAIMNELPDESRLKISVAVVTADRPLLLERCLQSLTRLTRFPDELVVADNSHDASVRQMVNQLQAPFPIQYFKLDQVGVARGRNAAARAAQGEIIAFVDDDATVEPEWLEGLERVFLRDPQVGLAAGSILNMACGRKDLVWNFMETVEKI